jgi:hypothetical protein
MEKYEQYLKKINDEIKININKRLTEVIILNNIAFNQNELLKIKYFKSI